MEEITLQKLPWSDSMLALLNETLLSSDDFDAAGVVREGVRSGRFEMWRLNGSSLAITETTGTTMRVHCYQGHDLKLFATFFRRIAERSGCGRVHFETFRKGLPRMLRAHSPRQVAAHDYEVTL